MGRFHIKEISDCHDIIIFYYLKNMVLNSLHRCNFATQRLHMETAEQENGMCHLLKYTFRNETILRIGEVAPEILKYFGIKQNVFYAEIDCDQLLALMERKKILFRELNGTGFGPAG